MIVPAFVYFFSQLYPFRWVAGRRRTTAAAGGCILVRRRALEAAGGVGAIRDAVIDDVALARHLKRWAPPYGSGSQAMCAASARIPGQRICGRW